MGILDKLKGLFKKEKGEKTEEILEEPIVVEIKPKEEIEKELEEKQKLIAKLYAEQGGGEPSDEVLEMQVELNQLRNKMNIPDKNNLDDEGWSQ